MICFRMENKKRVDKYNWVLVKVKEAFQILIEVHILLQLKVITIKNKIKILRKNLYHMIW
jgi:hypothetical protein